MLWYTGEKIGDQYRQLWRKSIKYKSDGAGMKSLKLRNISKFSDSSAGAKKKMENTTTLFVPRSMKSTLFKLIKQREEVLSKSCGRSILGFTVTLFAKDGRGQ